MLNRTSLAGFLGGVVLACTYSSFVGGCGTALGTIPLLLAWSIVAKLFGGLFADQHTWLSTLIAALAHGLFLFFLGFVIVLAIHRLPNKAVRVRFALLALLIFYGFLLFFAWPLRDCP
jgi:hypothetical protein